MPSTTRAMRRSKSRRSAPDSFGVARRGDDHGFSLDPTTSPAIASPELRAATRRFLETEIRFIPSKEFRTADCNSVLAATIWNQDDRAISVAQNSPRGLPPHLARLCAAPLLSAAEEQQLFFAMNYLKYRANALRAELDPEQPDAELLAAGLQFVADAAAIRDRIVRANMRLAISVVKKFVTPQVSFDDLLSEGTMTLLNAVEKFDYGRGFRFSTYAYRSVARSAYRAIFDRNQELARCAASEESLGDIAARDHSAAFDEPTWNLLRGRLTSLMNQLERREQFILRGRFALGWHRKVRTFQCLADKLGLSKERVRQLEQQAINKLRALASNNQPAAMPN